ncbi:hypothetical protein [Sporocytophaga myxococcoides]|uniref:hypothetical protein n=1 Tax=Sporocytophaga myxococcoides TaxID=153721 RepID=UPI0004255130|nr:hypothetical protein [Sporocytophaga myxococcoides]
MYESLSFSDAIASGRALRGGYVVKSLPNNSSGEIFLENTISKIINERLEHPRIIYLVEVALFIKDIPA